ncbi:MAG TPA: peptidylprolyl isomerase, partial [Erythrobacter sp.]|nr:peptidylprolyl isomerase [Erythrobacter sp.]
MKDMRTTLLALGAAAAAIGFHALAAQDTPDRSQDIAWMNAQQAYLTG